MLYLKKVVNYSIVKYVLFALEGLMFFIISKNLGPEMLGFYGFYTLFFSYLFIFSFGSIQSLNKDFSLGVVGKSNYIFHVLLIILSGFTLVVLLSIFLSSQKLLSKYLFEDYWILLSLWFLFANIQNLIVNIYRAEHKIDKVILIEFTFSFVKAVLILGFTFILQLKLSTIFIIILISYLINIIMNIRIFMVHLNIDFALAKHILTLGAGLLIYEILSIALLSVDRLIISIYYPAISLGEYTFAYTLNNFIFLLMNSIFFIIFPKILYYFNIMKIGYKKLFLIYNSYFNIFFGLLVFIISTIISTIIFQYYSEYVNSSFIFKSLVMSNLIYFSTFWITSFFIAKNQHLKIINSLIITLLVSISLNHTLVFFNIDFQWFSYINTITMYIYLISLINQLRSEYKNIFHDYYKIILFVGLLNVLFLLHILQIFTLTSFIGLITTLTLIFSKHFLKIIKNTTKLYKKIYHA